MIPRLPAGGEAVVMLEDTVGGCVGAGSCVSPAPLPLNGASSGRTAAAIANDCTISTMANMRLKPRHLHPSCVDNVCVHHLDLTLAMKKRAESVRTGLLCILSAINRYFIGSALIFWSRANGCKLWVTSKLSSRAAKRLPR